MQSISSQTPEGILGNGGMLDGDRERREEDRGRQREEWRVERGVSRGGRTQECAGVSRGTDLLRGLPNQRLCEVLRVRW
jgi:hypothetical protein